MINNRMSNRVRKYAAREMIYNNSKHAIYGLSYITNDGIMIKEIAETPNKIKYFYSDNSYHNCVDSIHQRYYDATVLAVHRNDYQ